MWSCGQPLLGDGPLWWRPQALDAARGRPAAPRKSVLRAVLLQALAGAQWRGKGKQLVKAAAMNRHPYR